MKKQGEKPIIYYFLCKYFAGVKKSQNITRKTEKKTVCWFVGLNKFQIIGLSTTSIFGATKSIARQ